MSFVPTWLAPWQIHLRELSLLALRLWLSQEFLFAAVQKLGGGLAPPQWFVGLSFPIPLAWWGPQFNWIAAGLGELVLGLALLVGLFTRLAALGLLFITYVAVYAVHFDLGWAGWRLIETDAGQGFKLPLMIALMLFVLVGAGGGRWSLQRWLAHHDPRFFDEVR